MSTLRVVPPSSVVAYAVTATEARVVVHLPKQTALTPDQALELASTLIDHARHVLAKTGAEHG